MTRPWKRLGGKHREVTWASSSLSPLPRHPRCRRQSPGVRWAQGLKTHCRRRRCHCCYHLVLPSKLPGWQSPHPACRETSPRVAVVAPPQATPPPMPAADSLQLCDVAHDFGYSRAILFHRPRGTWIPAFFHETGFLNTFSPETVQAKQCTPFRQSIVPEIRKDER